MLVFQILKILMIVTSGLTMWHFLKVAANNDSPVVVVLSGSMEPGFHRGDLLLLAHKDPNDMEIGDVVVYNLEGKMIPIVHRIHRIIEGEEEWEDREFLTKGDANQEYDTWLYTTGNEYLAAKDVVGTVRAYFPGLGYATILMNEHPWARNVLFGFLGLLALLGHDD
ncbi:peptidase S26B [Kipferlia bialata]|uniref:Signal peptidase complex catalytic subunit SEC11 n=1 Tax=Kipferlia bialata TaxID=797122 RepID=A0A9K3CWU1_9EUKA|nr:peptidase S26B [Kipferlia bialata]|eukprot:g5926.t1